MGLEDTRFKHPWRGYQAKVLEELGRHLGDDRLHIVAAPGSGKTVLGLEVMRRLGQPALVLAPTRVIRDQWAARLVELFLPDGAGRPDWLSTDPAAPGLVTVLTYQGLHAALAGVAEADEDGDEDGDNGEPALDEAKDAPLIAALRAQGVRTLVLDEAHHLRKEWWRALMQVKAMLGVERVVSLTATPPYDVEPTQWRRYLELCGEIDAEISVPELVASGDLAPHADFVYLCAPTEDEQAVLTHLHRNIEQLRYDLLADEALVAAVENLPGLRDPVAQVETILDRPEAYSCLLVYLDAAGRVVPFEALDVLGVDGARIPAFDDLWLERFLDVALFQLDGELAALGADVDDLRTHARRLGLIERRRAVVGETARVARLLNASLGKLSAITDIVAREGAALGDGFRCVVLSDHIRRAYLPVAPGHLPTIDKLGVVPIFEVLRRAAIPGVSLGLLSGSLILLPASAGELLWEVVAREGIDPARLSLEPAAFDPDYFEVRIGGEAGHRIVHLVTEVFQAGAVNVLVGTQALLGEGWDAPAVNTLVLASTVRSFMLSNQMRGRAIRIDPARADKVANIWHLAAVDAADPATTSLRRLGPDLGALARRFRAFEGVTADAPYSIENGIARLGLAGLLAEGGGVARANQAVFEAAVNRAEIARHWRVAERGNSEFPMMRERVSTDHRPQSFIHAKTAKACRILGIFLAVELILGTGVALADLGTQLMEIAVAVMGAVAVPPLVVLIRAMPTLFLTLRHRNLPRSLEAVGTAVLDGLVLAREVVTARDDLTVVSGGASQDQAYCALAGGDRLERAIFVEAMAELLDHVDNPRYLIRRRTRSLGIQLADYHAVPTRLARRKADAEAFYLAWRRHVGDGELIYTRTPDGRRDLIRARGQAISAAADTRTERKTVWE